MGQRSGVKKVRITHGKHNILVVRISPDNQLCDSKPCCMCINLMRMYGIKKVYYSDCDGNMCYQKISRIPEDFEDHVSHGLKIMVRCCIYDGSIVHKKLPLTKTQKSLCMKRCT